MWTTSTTCGDINLKRDSAEQMNNENEEKFNFLSTILPAIGQNRGAKHEHRTGYQSKKHFAGGIDGFVLGSQQYLIL